MTVFGNSGGGFLSGKQVFPVDYEAEASQRLLDACLRGDLKSVSESIADPSVDVNFVGAVCLKARKTEVLLRDECASEVRVEFDEFKTDVTPLFVAVHTGNVALVKKLLISGGLYQGYNAKKAVNSSYNMEFMFLARQS